MSWTELQQIEHGIRDGAENISVSAILINSDHHHHLHPLVTDTTEQRQRHDVTVIIPTHRRVPVGLDAFVKQSRHVHVLLNGAVDIPHIPDVQVRLLSWKGHGRTRQEALEHVHTPYVFFTVDDAIPLPNCLERLVTELEQSDWDAVIARQIPFPTADRYTKDQLALWTPHGDAPYRVAQCDHVGTLYRTETLKEHPIPDVPIAEDAWWSVNKGIGCVPSACIVHSHPRRTVALMRREYAIHKQLKAISQNHSDTSTIALRGMFRGTVHAAMQYGVKEGLRVTAQNLARFAAHKL